MQAFEIVFLCDDAVGGGFRLNVALLEFLPKGETARSTSFEAESGLFEGGRVECRVGLEA